MSTTQPGSTTPPGSTGPSSPAPGLMATYGRLPVSFSHGEGVWLYDTTGRRYLDAISGVGVNALGHAHPRVTRTLCEQGGRLIHTSNLYSIEHQQALAEALCRASGMEQAFFCNSGAEANEAAIKLARLYGHRRGVERPSIVVFEKAFHGRTLATLTASGSRKIQAGFEPLVAGFIRAPFGDLQALHNIGNNNPGVVAVLLEPVQGEGGINLPPEGFLRRLCQLCDERGWLLMLDEVQSGNGRTGRYFAYQHDDILPDVVATAKGLGNGLPIGACLARGEAANVFQPGNHGSTFGGNPLACAVALAVVDTLVGDDLIGHAAREGAFLLEALQRRLSDVAGVRDVRGLGLMLGIELERPCGELVGRALEQGLLINVTADQVVRLLPPLIIQREASQHLIDTLCPLIEAFCKAPG